MNKHVQDYDNLLEQNIWACQFNKSRDPLFSQPFQQLLFRLLSGKGYLQANKVNYIKH